MKLIKLSLFIFILLSSACSFNLTETHWRGTTLVFGPDNRPKVENLVEIEQIWQEKVSKAYDQDAQGFQISVENGLIYFASQQGKLTAVVAESGEIKWSSDTKQELSAGVSLGQQLIFSANTDGQVLAYDKTNGELQWQQQLTSEVLTSPVQVNDIVVARSQDGKIVGLKVNSGEPIWQVQRDLPNLTLRREVPPTVVGNTVILGLPTGNLLAINALDGQILWEIPISVPAGVNEIQRMRDIAGQPIINGSVIYSNTFQGDVVAIDASKRGVVWQQEIDSFHPMSDDQNNLYIASSESKVIAIAKDSGDIIWTSDELSKQEISLPTVVGQYLLVFGDEGEAYILDKNTGKILGKYNLSRDYQVIGKPIVNSGANPEFYVLSNAGQLYSYRISVKQPE